MGSKGKQPFSHMKHHLDLIYMYTEYHQNISEGLRVIEHISLSLKVHSREKTQKGSMGEQPFLYMTN